MEKSYYVITFRPDFARLLRSKSEGRPEVEGDREDDARRVLVSITQGGFGQDVVDDLLQVKERFLEYLFSVEGIDLPRSADVFDSYFAIERAEELIDLDEEL